MSDLKRWASVTSGPFSFRPGGPDEIRIVHRFVDADGNFTGEVSCWDSKTGRDVLSFNPEIAGTRAPGVTVPETPESRAILMNNPTT